MNFALEPSSLDIQRRRHLFEFPCHRLGHYSILLKSMNYLDKFHQKCAAWIFQETASTWLIPPLSPTRMPMLLPSLHNWRLGWWICLKFTPERVLNVTTMPTYSDLCLWIITCKNCHYRLPMRDADVEARPSPPEARIWLGARRNHFPFSRERDRYLNSSPSF